MTRKAVSQAKRQTKAKKSSKSRLKLKNSKLPLK
jgi:hypothetical protein